MRWQIHGTDALTGQSVRLALEAPEATLAVQTALTKRILVNKVSREASTARRKMTPFMFALALVATPVAGILYQQNAKLREAAERARPVAPVVVAAQPDERLREQIRQLNSQLLGSEGELAGVRQRLAELQKAAARVPAMESDLAARNQALAAAQSAVTQLSVQVAQSREKLEELASRPALAPATSDAALARAVELEQSNKVLAAQVEVLKGQLLVAAANSTPSPNEPDVPVSAPPPASMRWALRTSYDAAADFLALHFDKETFATTAATEGLSATTGMNTGLAATLRLTHDARKRRVYAGLLAVTLTPDAPKDKLGENVALATDFLRTFAPSLKNPGTVIANAPAELTGKDPSHRWVVVADDARLTMWNNAQGQLMLKLESPAPDAAE